MSSPLKRQRQQSLFEMLPSKKQKTEASEEIPVIQGSAMVAEKKEDAKQETEAISTFSQLISKELNDKVASLKANKETTPEECRNTVEASMKSLADKLLNHSLFIIRDIAFRLCEIEFYYYHPNVHPDPFVHCDELQLNTATFYFHRVNNSGYRGGTFKGIDITFGDKSDKAYGGILIRSIQKVTGKDLENVLKLSKASSTSISKIFSNLKSDSDSELIDGPSLCVDKILKINDAKSIDEFVKNFRGVKNNGKDDNLTVDADQDLCSKDLRIVYLPSLELSQRTIYGTPRVGLTLKKSSGSTGNSKKKGKNNSKKGKKSNDEDDADEDEDNEGEDEVNDGEESGKLVTIESQRIYLLKHFRFLSLPTQIKKGKHYLIMSLYKDGKNADQIKNMAGSTAKTIDKIIECCNKGKKMTNQQLNTYSHRNLSNDDISELYGKLML